MPRVKTSNDGDTKSKLKLATEPKFPYTTKPSSLRRLLQDIPKKPKPSKFDRTLLKAWGFSDANDHSMLRVLKAAGLLNASNEPTDLYSRYMDLDNGSAALAEPIKRVYAPLFQASHAPYKEPTEKLQNLFNIHSGGGERTLDQQIQTFKALCENTTFDVPGGSTVAPNTSSLPTSTPVTSKTTSDATASVHIDLHIHLPENKSRRDYENIIEDIGRYIFGRADTRVRDE
jgi:hypothetical protein